ncbi:probable ubiquitin carboxyl-terminal hydrolase MINDY-4 [Galendromus occidentalis]|uniref:Ubiquitin carboxyl-terminal hydrolase MINDY n=1 Tax=Galendromus occidentalis TaxID=34638 RepID=A0AAJ7WHU0_9ACAR|nr:probable ubiquitin carboxyl-terminal hydrolase MINDY-4 [Galendromus occidentalis]
MSDADWTHVDRELRTQLFDTVLGRGRKFPKVWLVQHIDFPSIQNECRLQIKQYHNGPCGAVASIQAWFLKSLMFGKMGKLPHELSEKSKLLLLRKRGLIEALSGILFHVTPLRKGPVRLIVPFPSGEAYNEDQYYESWHYTTLSTLDEVRAAVDAHFENICHYGMVPFVCSLILSRGIVRVHTEAAKDTLVDPFQEDCFQTLVNLILTGRAVSHVFDAPQFCTEEHHPKYSRYGIVSRSIIGFMTSVELHNRTIVVGNHYKVPYHPIWVIHGESHYSVLFCQNRQVLQHMPTNDTFQWYTVTSFRGILLNKQFTLTIDSTGPVTSRAPKMEQSVRVVRECVGLRWPCSQVGLDDIQHTYNAALTDESESESENMS